MFELEGDVFSIFLPGSRRSRARNIVADKPQNKTHTHDNLRFYTSKTEALYFVFQPTVGAPVDEITTWLNGGPGELSLESFFQGNGDFVWGYGQYAPTINPYAWVNLTNVLWVEQPVGTGFSIGEVTATNETDAVKDFNSFFLNFLQTFGIKNFKIFLTGESYAGRYVPHFSSAMIDRKRPVYFNVSGALMYDPCIGSYVWEQNHGPIVPFAVKDKKVLERNASFLTQLQARDKTSAFVAPNPCFNIPEISSQCPLRSDSLGYPTGLQYLYPGQPIYSNRTDMKKTTNAPLGIGWLECKGPGDTSPDPIQSVLPRVIGATNRVLISNGDLDMSIIADGTLLAIPNMCWGGEPDFQSQPNTSIVITLLDLQYAATFEANNGLMWAQTYLSGHMEVQSKPRSSYRHLQWLLGHIEMLQRNANLHLTWPDHILINITKEVEESSVDEYP
ncbi:alpha/beta-hydrolase [Hyaloscypha bicolor E]|uniref:Carboxypeptidase n=1 Tax=Hyaloscypha bicolor E TaxID=1095630 RepID=A0A2J6T586_9HELO|nr:alpha/beta-hydrolase [Hyaloscypha bicolor E]PMD58178.1 alpha/beta-hydrolase [Hyaloscypha bicolor E]